MTNCVVARRWTQPGPHQRTQDARTSLSLAMAIARDVNEMRCEQPMIPTFVFGWPTGEETGEYLAVDLGMWVVVVVASIRTPSALTSPTSPLMGTSSFSRGKAGRICVCAWSLYKGTASSRSRNPSIVFRKNKSRKKAKSCLTFAPSASRRSSRLTSTRAP